MAAPHPEQVIPLIHAELNGKDSTHSRMSDMEDVLTSNVFGVLGTIEPEVLRSFLGEALGITFVNGPFDLQFWPKQFIGIKDWWACEPDVIITGQGIVVFVEAKLGAEFGKGDDYEFEGNQLPREHKALSEYSPQTPADKYLLIVTSDIVKPKAKIEAQFHHCVPLNVRWANWQQVWRTLAYGSDQVTCPVSRKWIGLLKGLLEKKGLDEFVGMGSVQLLPVGLVTWECLA